MATSNMIALCHVKPCFLHLKEEIRLVSFLSRKLGALHETVFKYEAMPATFHHFYALIGPCLVSKKERKK